MTSPGDHAERFTHLRPLLFTIAYEILGSATESDDVLQDSYLRWAGVDLATVRDTKSYLAQLVTSQALNALRTRARRREDYVGPWLPEPVLVDADASADVVLAESVSMAMLVLLRRMERPDLTVHGFRSSFRDWASEITDFPSEVVEMALAHTVESKVERAYRRGDLFEKRRELMDAWAAWCTSVGGRQ